MKVKQMVILFFLVIIMMGCAGEKEATKHDKTVKLQEPITKHQEVKIYNIDLEKLLLSQNIYQKLHQFPFVNENANLDFRGHFPIEFYQSFNYEAKAEEISNVDFWKLRNYPYFLDIIYVKPIWLENFKYASKDLFENICYTYNISKREQYVLLWWIKNGGILWVESGLYATGFENIKRDGSIDLEAIKRRMIKLTKNLHFLEYPVKTTTYIVKDQPLTGIEKNIVFDNLTINKKFLEGIATLEINLKYPLETFFYIAAGDGAIKDKKGKQIVNIIKYYKGKIIFLYPFEYVNAYRDGELLRWKLLDYIYTNFHFSLIGKKLGNKK